MPPAADVQGQLAEWLHVTQQQMALHAAQQLVALWLNMNVDDIDRSWEQIQPQVLAALIAAQVQSAGASAAYLQQLFATAGVTAGETLQPAAFAGYTSAGIPLAGLLPMVPADMKTRIGAGVSPPDAAAATLSELQTLAVTEGHDAGRTALYVGSTTTPGVRGYARIPDANACDRCILLAGRIYHSTAAFLRHPRCGCTQRVLLDGEWYDGPTPKQLFDGLTPEEQDRRFGKANAEAIRSGSDLGRVVNAKSGMSGAGDFFTTKGTREISAHGGPGNVRLSPYGCQAAAHGDHLRYLELLRAEGYIV